jgi:hypothetical protein
VKDVPKGYPKHKEIDTAVVNQISAKIEALQERLKLELGKHKGRDALVRFASKRGMTRADMYAAAAKLPLERISKKSRLERAQKAKEKA